jgi:hypothetical protein
MRRRRDRDRELCWLANAEEIGHRIDAAARNALPVWTAAATFRLEVGAAEYGDTWHERGALALVREAMEEAADLGGWAVLADQALDDLALANHGVAVRGVLTQAAAHAAASHALLQFVVDLLEEIGE